MQRQREEEEERKQEGGTQHTALLDGMPKSVWKIGVFHSSDRPEEVGHMAAFGYFGNL